MRGVVGRRRLRRAGIGLLLGLLAVGAYAQGGMAPDLIVTKDDGGVLATPGDTVIYAITLENAGGTATGVLLRDVAPENVTFNAAMSDPAWVCSNPLVSCFLSFATVAAGAPPQTVQIAFDVISPLPSAAQAMRNTVRVGDDGSSGLDLDPSNNFAFDVTPFSPDTGPDLVVTKTDGGAVVGAGDQVVYTITVANEGTQNTDGVVLSDAVPENTTFSSAGSHPGWSCSGGTCSLAVGFLGVLDAPQSFDIAFAVDLPLAAGVSEIRNTATATDDGSSEPDLDPSSDSATDVTPIDFAGGTGPDLVLMKDDGGVNVDAGGTVAYTLTVGNAGTQDASGVTITDTIPANTTFSAGASSPGWSCAGGACTLQLGPVAAGAPSQQAVVAFDVVSPVPAGVTAINNNASVSDDGSGGADLAPFNNTATDTTPLGTGPGGGTAPDLALSKDDGGVTVDAGDTIVYALTVQNQGNQDAAGVTVTETVPAHARFDGASSDSAWSCSGVAAGSTCTLSVTLVPAGAAPLSYAFAVDVESPVAAGVNAITNTATVADDGSGGVDPDLSNNTATDSTPLGTGPGGGTAPDLAVVKNDGGITADAGDTIVYTLSVQNEGNQDAAGVTVTETVPANAQFDASSSDSAWSCAGVVAGSTCTLSVSLVPAGTAPLSFLFAVDVDSPVAAGATEITNTATAADDGSGGVDPDPSNNTATDTTPLDTGPGGGTAPDLGLSKDDGGVTADAGDTVIYTLSLQNLGHQDASGVVITETVPAHVRFNAPASDGAWSCTGVSAGSTCTLNVPLVAADAAPLSFLLAVDVASPVAAGVTQLTNTATVIDDGSGGVDPDLSNNSATDSTPLGTGPGGDTAPDLAVVKSDGGVTADAGGTVVYTLSVENLGNQDASGVEMTDVVPDHTRFDALASDVGWSCPDSGPGSSCTFFISVLPAGSAPQDIQFAVTVDSPLAAGVTAVTNTATVDDDGTGGVDPDLSNNTASVTTPISSGPGGGTGPDLVLIKDDAGVSVGAGESVTYTLTVENVGNQHASGVVITDTVPANASFNSPASTPGWSCTAGTCTLGVGGVDVGAVALTVGITFVVDDPLPAGVTEISNTATVTDDGSGGADLDPADNTDTEITPISTGSGSGPDLVVTLDDGGALASAGEVVIHTVSVENVGNRGATGVVLEHIVPHHVAFESSASDSAWVCADVAPDSVCTLGVGALAVNDPAPSFEIAFRVDSPMSAGVREISASVTATDDGTNGTDLDPTDNSATESTPLRMGAGGTGPDLVVVKDDGGTTVKPDGLVLYTISVSNTGNQHASGVVVNDLIPELTTFSAVASGPEWGCGETTCSLLVGDVAAGAPSQVYVIGFVLSADVIDRREIENVVSVSDDGSGGEDLDPSDNSTSEATPIVAAPPPPVGEPEVVAEKTDWLVDGEPYGIEGLVIEYDVLVRNVGKAAALELTYSVALDPHTRYLEGSASSEGGLVIEQGGTFVVERRTLEPRDEMLIFYAVEVVDSDGLTEVQAQGRIESPHFTAVLTDDPDTPEPNDPTVTELGVGLGVVDIPVLSPWGLVMFLMVLGGFAFWRLREER
ncbi:MAG: DUF11 domain-containing protein [bacterium]|nr:DUF11 domain-containing protein [bacterium]